MKLIVDDVLKFRNFNNCEHLADGHSLPSVAYRVLSGALVSREDEKESVRDGLAQTLEMMQGSFHALDLQARTSLSRPVVRHSETPTGVCARVLLKREGHGAMDAVSVPRQ
ncbi:hypothetical protein AJ80_00156 [Polytolypa hystricis UAMH7299]|uniref:Uncharacterized protein n=1 Tax=Polytolypa hystricis (strain UAMH7299) TaxID=1447883 RepID=A0A2B7Z3U5_POLH7|nr:hypothetical protein AJ80_00156 [Polytolypa hystricis UAMH7299]